MFEMNQTSNHDWYNVLLRSDLNVINSLCYANKNLKSICDNDHFWLDKLSVDYPNINPNRGNKSGSYKELYIWLNSIGIANRITNKTPIDINRVLYFIYPYPLFSIMETLTPYLFKNEKGEIIWQRSVDLTDDQLEDDDRYFRVWTYSIVPDIRVRGREIIQYDRNSIILAVGAKYPVIKEKSIIDDKDIKFYIERFLDSGFFILEDFRLSISDFIILGDNNLVGSISSVRYDRTGNYRVTNEHVRDYYYYTEEVKNFVLERHGQYKDVVFSYDEYPF